MHPWDSILARGHTALLVVRHGRTRFNRERRFLGRTDLPLDDEGREQVRTLAPWRGAFAQVVSSPLARARMTAEVLGDDVALDGDLAELDQGELEGLLVDEAVQAHPDFFAAWAEDPGPVQVPGGGRLDRLRDDAMAALIRWAEAHPGQAVAVASHQLVLASVLATLENRPLSEWRSYALPNAGAALLAYDGQSLTIAQRPLLPPTP